jgi:hypothetical protein
MGCAEIDCNHSASVEVQACMQQLVTGGWQTMNWTCRTFGPRDQPIIFVATAGVSYYTANRYYRTWAWGSVNGATGTTLSSSCKGNGGAGCN